MRVRTTIAVCGLWLLAGLAPALAQFIPEPPSRVPAPLPPPPPPPIISGPLQLAPPPGVYVPPGVNTQNDRITGCLHEGASAGLRGRRLRAYANECANAN